MSTFAIMEDMKLFCQVCTEFWPNSNDYTDRLGINTTENAFEMY